MKHISPMHAISVSKMKFGDLLAAFMQRHLMPKNILQNKCNDLTTVLYIKILQYKHKTAMLQFFFVLYAAKVQLNPCVHVDQLKFYSRRQFALKLQRDVAYEICLPFTVRAKTSKRWFNCFMFVKFVFIFLFAIFNRLLCFCRSTITLFTNLNYQLSSRYVS